MSRGSLVFYKVNLKCGIHFKSRVQLYEIMCFGITLSLLASRNNTLCNNCCIRTQPVKLIGALLPQIIIISNRLLGHHFKLCKLQ